MIPAAVDRAPWVDHAPRCPGLPRRALRATPPELESESCTMRREVEVRIAAVAAGQHGVVTRGQLLEAGLSRAGIAHRLDAGSIRRLHRGVFLVGPLLAPHTAEMAAVLASGGHGLVSHTSAASLWALGAARAAGEPVEIVRAGTSRACHPGIRVHRTAGLEAEDRAVVNAIPVTAPVRTLVDLAGVVGSGELERAVARAEREGLVTREALLARVARSGGRRGIVALRRLLGIPGGPALTRSEAEAAFLALVREAGLPAPEANAPFGRYELDFLWRAEGVAVEVDGFRSHSTRPRFEGDRRKDARLLAAGIKVLRVTWRQIADDAVATAVQVGQALARAGAERGGRTR